MALIEKQIAELIIELEAQVATGHDYTPSTDVLPVLHDALNAFQTQRGQMAKMAELVESLAT